jgi:hypothetical protein
VSFQAGYHQGRDKNVFKKRLFKGFCDASENNGELMAEIIIRKIHVILLNNLFYSLELKGL